jgi:hypothetical protein
MKKITVILLTSVCLAAWMSCKNAEARYVDLNTGDRIKVKKDTRGRLVNAADEKPVRFYVDTKTSDTLDGRTGKVVNGELVKVDDGTYEYLVVRETLAADDEFKRKIEEDGDIKIKTSKKKIKIDGKTGKRKVKAD